VRTIAIPALVLGAIVASFGSIPAASAAPNGTGLDGFVCGLAGVVNPGASLYTETGQVTAGPAFIDDGANPPGVHSGNFICTVQTGAANSTHAGVDAAVVEGPTTTAVIAAQGQVFYFMTTPLDDVYVCTEIVVDGTHLYFDDPHDRAVTGSFDTSPNVDCGAAARADGSTVGELLDSLVCPVLDRVLPPQGDVVLPVLGKVWDCPPYDPAGPRGRGLTASTYVPPVTHVRI
jgi:hypothetical protein